jgi:gentisate 1,2-dioxygenase
MNAVTTPPKAEDADAIRQARQTFYGESAPPHRYSQGAIPFTLQDSGA